jgi:inner membrane protein
MFNGASMKNSFFLKCLTLGAIGSLLFVFLLAIQGVIWDRQNYRQQAINSIASTSGGPQSLLGPLVYSACTETYTTAAPRNKDEAATPVEQKREFTLLSTAQSLQIKGNTQVESRARGLHSTNVHNTKAVISANWESLGLPKPVALHKDSRLQCGAPTLMLGVEDPRGIRQANLKIGEQTYKFKAGTMHPHYKQGLHVVLPDSLVKNEAVAVEIEVEVAGVERLAIVPLAESTQMQMQSNWPHPSFGGRFAPAQRTITDKGFDASWRVTSLAANAAQGVAQELPLCGGDADSNHANSSCVGTMQIGFVEPINLYSLSDRATKYGLLFVALTFVAVGMFEVMKKLRVHPVQYLLVGAAICTFFLLLVSLSEHIGFMMAYAAGAAATTLLLAYYASHMLGGWVRGLPFGGLIALLYGMLYALLQLEQTALMIGSIAMFVVLAAVMVLTRKVDWYAQLGSGGKAPSPFTPYTTPPTTAQVAAAGMQ